jgi:hypothetical protein
MTKPVVTMAELNEIQKWEVASIETRGKLLAYVDQLREALRAVIGDADACCIESKHIDHARTVLGDMPPGKEG